MRFFLHGTIHPEAQAAMHRHHHICHTPLELAEGSGSAEGAPDTPQLLTPLLEKMQWNMITNDADFVRDLYEHKVQYSGIIVLLPADHEDTAGATIDRLFERYPRLTPRRMYTVTASRVKIRQLPGATGAPDK